MTGIEQSLDEIINRLIDNGQSARYQFERASEPLLGPFLVDWLSQRLKIDLKYLANEFPIKRQGCNLSSCADYILGAEDAWYLVEVKTTSAKIRKQQFEDYQSAIEGNSLNLLQGLSQLSRSKSRLRARYNGVLHRVGKAPSAIHVIFVTPHAERPALDERFDWHPLSHFFTDYSPKKHHDLWKFVHRLKHGVQWPNQRPQTPLTSNDEVRTQAQC